MLSKRNRLRTSCALAVGRGDFKMLKPEDGAVKKPGQMKTNLRHDKRTNDKNSIKRVILTSASTRKMRAVTGLAYATPAPVTFFRSRQALGKNYKQHIHETI